MFFGQITGQGDLIEARPGKYHQMGPALTGPKAYFGEGFGMAFRKKDTALAAVKADGTYAQIHERCFHKAPPAAE